MWKWVFLLIGTELVSACSVQSLPLYRGQLQSLNGGIPVCSAPMQPIGKGGQWSCMTPAQVEALTRQSEARQQQTDAQHEQDLISSPALSDERASYHQNYLQSEVARYRQAIQQCSQRQASGALGIDNGRYQDCMTEAREQFQMDQGAEQGFAARDEMAHAEAPAEAKAIRSGQVTPPMLQICHAFGVYGPQRCAEAYPKIVANLR